MCARILIVEDEQIIAADLEEKLLRLGHQVVGASISGEEAIRLAETLRPELVLMDIRIEGALDGAEAARRIQATTGIPVIFVTAYGERFLFNPPISVSPALCLTKPFSSFQLRELLEIVLGKPSVAG